MKEQPSRRTSGKTRKTASPSRRPERVVARPRRALVGRWQDAWSSEPLEARLLFSFTFAGLQFTSTATTGAAAQETALNTLLTTKAGGPVTFNGSVQSAATAADKISGALTFSVNSGGASFAVAATGVSATLGGGGNAATVSNASGSFTLYSDGVDANLSVPLATGFALPAGSHVSVAGQATVGLQWNTRPGTTDAHTRVSATGVSLTLGTAGDTLAGNFSFEGGATGVTVAASGVAFSLYNSPPGTANRRALATVQNAGGTLTVTGQGVSGSGAFTAGVSFDTAADSPAFALAAGGTFGFAVNTLPTNTASPRLQLTATNLNVTVGGQTFGGGFAFEQSADGGVHVAATVNAFNLGGIVSVQSAGARFDWDPTGFSGLMAAAGTVTAAGVSGTGQYFLAVNTSADGDVDLDDPTDPNSAIPGAAHRVVNVPAGPAVVVAALQQTLTVGGVALLGDFTFTARTGGVTLTAANASLHVGTAFAVTAASGHLELTSSAVTGGVEGTAAVTAGANVSVSGHFAASFSSTGVDLSSSDLRVTAFGQELTGGFSVSSGAGTTLTVSDAAVSFGGGLVSVTAINGDLTFDGTSASGSIAGTLAAGSGAATFDGSASVAFGATGVTVSATAATLSVGGQSISGGLTVTQVTGGPVSVAVTGATASLGGGLVKVTGSTTTPITLNTDGTITGGFTGTLSAGTVGGAVSFGGAIAVTIAPGSITAVTPAGQTNTLAVDGFSLSGALSFGLVGGALSLGLTEGSLSLANNAVSVAHAAGTLAIAAGGISGSAEGDVAAAGGSMSGRVGLAFAPGALAVSGTGVRVAVGTETVSGDFTFTGNSAAASVGIAVKNVNASLGSGLVKVGGGTGNLNVTSAGVTGSVSGTVSAGSGVSGVAFDGAIAVSVTPTEIRAGTGGQVATLAVGGQRYSAALDFFKSAGVLQLTVSKVNVSLGGGVIALANGTGTLTVGTTGVSGDLSGTVSSTVAGFTADLGMRFGPTGASVT
ncbi:MAG TPA: hypothetical protein VF796_06790, partial [Humisphaera sp.]